MCILASSQALPTSHKLIYARKINRGEEFGHVLDIDDIPWTWF